MLDFSDLPYRFVPPKPNALVIAIARFANRHFALPGKNHLVEGVSLAGAEAFAEARRDRRARFVLLPNHPTHSDPQLMTEVCRRLRVKPAFMAAYDVFARGKFGAWFMQRTGAFSVDREGSDRKAMRCAAEVLAAGRYPLVIFPEGNVYLCNDRVTPFAEGAAYIALRAQKELGDSAPVYAVPVSLKYTYVEDVRETVLIELEKVAASFGTDVDRDAPIAGELKRVSVTALARYLRQHGHIPAHSERPVDEQISHAAGQIIASLESKIDLAARPTDDLTARVRKVRATIHSVRTDPERDVDQRAASHWADEAMLALRILGYAGGYTASNPTLDRAAETVARLREDVRSELFPPDGHRRALVQIGTPIDLRERLADFREGARDAIQDLTDVCEAGVQGGVDRLNSTNDEPGAQPFYLASP